MKRRTVVLWGILFILFLCVIGWLSLCERQKETVTKWEYEEKEKEMRQDLFDGGVYVPTPKEVWENPYIYRYNHKLCKEKGLIKGESLDVYYLCLQAIYRANLDALLLKELDIGKLEDELKKSSLGFASRRQREQELYEKEATMRLEFILLRNNLYIEYLKEDQIELLKEKLYSGKPFVTDELQKMVEKTCQEVIRVRNPKDWEDKRRFLYSEVQGRKPVIPNQALVLEIANVMEYDASGNLLLNEHMTEKCEYLDKVKGEKEKEYSDILGMEVYILLA